MSTQEQVTSIFVPTSNLLASPTNPRKRFDEEKIQGMADTMATVGVLQPLVVRNFKGKKGKYEIVAGETRWRAATVAGLDQVPVIIRELTDQQVIKIQVIENLQRNDLHALEEAGGFKALLDQSQDLVGYTIDDLAKEVGKSRTYVYDSLKLLELPDSAKESFYEGKLNRSTALLFARLEPETRTTALIKFEESEEDLSYRDTKTLVDEVVQTSAQLNAAKAIVEQTIANGEKAVLLDTQELRQEWAPYGLHHAEWKSAPGYTTLEHYYHFPQGEYQGLMLKNAISLEEIADQVTLVNLSAESVTVINKDEAVALLEKKIQEGTFTPQKRQPPEARGKSQWELEREAREQEETRREALADACIKHFESNGILTSGVTELALLRLSFTAMVKHLEYNGDALLAALGLSTEQDLFAMANKAKNPLIILKLITAVMSFYGATVGYGYPDDDEDDEAFATLSSIANLAGIPTTLTLEDLSTPPSAAQAQESKAPENQEAPVAELAGDLSPEEAALIEPAAQADETSAAQAPKTKFDEIKAKALARKQKKESAKADESNGTAAAAAA